MDVVVVRRDAEHFRYDLGGPRELPNLELKDATCDVLTDFLMDNTVWWQDFRPNIDKRIGDFDVQHALIMCKGSGKGIIIAYGPFEVIEGRAKHPVRFYTFAACEHEFKVLESRMCYWRGVCVKCGYTTEVDSSD